MIHLADDPPFPAPPLAPYVALVTAILHRAVEDAQGRCTHADRHQRDLWQADARRFLADADALTWWLDLCALDSPRLVLAMQGVLAPVP